MKASYLLHKRKILFVVLLIAFSALTVDIMDLREELQFRAVPYSGIDNDITTAIISNASFKMEPVLFWCFVHQKSSVEISFIHLLPYGFRAPPFLS